MKVDLEQAMAQEELRAARNPNPVAPKTDTPATPTRKSYAGACWNQLMEDESKESLAEMLMDSWDKCRALEGENRGGLEVLRISESTLAAERQEKVRIAENLANAEDAFTEVSDTLAAERASRVQAEDQAFNAGIVEAAKAARDWNPEKHGDSVDAIMAKAKPCTPETHIWRSGECMVCDVSKPSVSPVRAEEEGNGKA